jgi:DNA-binding HxlR family transcriptional regulator
MQQREVGNANMPDEKVQYSCPATIAMDLMQGKWRIQILSVMQNGPIRFGQLGRLIPLASSLDFHGKELT